VKKARCSIASGCECSSQIFLQEAVSCGLLVDALSE
jgi:hypothetical protein